MTETGTVHSAAGLTGGPAPRSEKHASTKALPTTAAVSRASALRVGVMGHLTTTTAFMNGCGVQWKAYCPGCVNVCAHVLPGSMAPESHDPSSAVMVWTSGSLLVHWTVVPAVISNRFCPKFIPRISALVAFAAPSPPPAAAALAAVLLRRPKYLLNVKGIVNSNPPRTLSMPREAPCSVAVFVLVTCSDSVCGE